MRKRNKQINVRLNEHEFQKLKLQVKQSDLSQEAYVRHLINGFVPVASPPADYYSMMKELHSIGNNLNQISRKAHQLDVIDIQQYDRSIKALEEAIIAITEAVILPKSIVK